MNGVKFAALQSLIERLPFPLVLFDNRSGTGFANNRFADIFVSGQLDSPDLKRLARSPGGAWEPAKLLRCDGRDVVARAQAVEVGDGVLLVFDNAGGPTSTPEIERLQERITELEGLSATDSLTGAWNRVQLNRMVEVEISRAKRSGQPVTLILLDVDHFKRVNDVYGHLAGDTVLKEFVDRIRERVRDADTLFRWGGEEFAVLATAVGYRGGAVLAEDLRMTIAAVPFKNVGQITASLGVAEHMDGETAQRWFKRADEALYAAKLAGRNRIHLDRQGSSQLGAGRAGMGVLRLYWLDAYECGEPTIDTEHRELFDLGNTLIASAIEQYSEPALWRTTLDAMLAHLAHHFRDEEALLSQRGYAGLAEHQRAHAGLLWQADELKAAVEGGEATLGHLVNFLVNDVITLHILKIDRDFYPLFQSEKRGSAAPPRA